MPVLTPGIIRDRYAQVKVQREQGGRNVLLGLPERRGGELERVVSILASTGCRECAKCCSGGFSFTKKDPNFEGIMRGIRENGKKFILEGDGRIFAKDRVFRVFVPRGKRACGFLQGSEAAYSELQFSEGFNSDEDAFFGCGIYGGRPSVCKSYPFIWEVFDEKYWIRGESNSLLALDPVCPAISEIAYSGIGHFSAKEIEILLEEGKGVPESLLGSLAGSLAEVFRRIGEDGKWGRIFVDEKGEKIYPLDFPPVIHSLRDY